MVATTCCNIRFPLRVPQTINVCVSDGDRRIGTNSEAAVNGELVNLTANEAVKVRSRSAGAKVLESAHPCSTEEDSSQSPGHKRKRMQRSWSMYVTSSSLNSASSPDNSSHQPCAIERSPSNSESPPQMWVACRPPGKDSGRSEVLQRLVWSKYERSLDTSPKTLEKANTGK